MYKGIVWSNMTPTVLTGLLEAKVIPSSVSIVLDTMLLRFSGPNVIT